MRPEVMMEQRQQFYHRGYIEFESVLTENQVDDLRASIDEVLARRLDEEYFRCDRDRAGRDVWRDDAVISKSVKNRVLAEIASQLTKKRAIRLAYDQCITATTPLVAMGTSLEQQSSVQGLLIATLLCLVPDTTGTAPAYFPSAKGNTMYIQKDFLMAEVPAGNGSYLLIAYCEKTSIYRCNKEDKNFDALKRSGYNYGDLLVESQNPMLFRQ